jgi:membrane protein required for beta-lactamase induction
MKFLVILICVTANYFWRRDYDRISDTWFFNLRAAINKATSEIGGEEGFGWIVGLLAILLLPIALLVAVLVLIESWFFGLFTLLVHILMLLMVFDRTHPGSLAQGYLDRWLNGDIEGSFRYLEQELSCQNMPPPTDIAGLHNTFCKLYVYRCFEKMFVMFFWYLLAGPIGIMFAYICYQLRECEEVPQNDNEVVTVRVLIEILEWAPVRLLGMTLSLVGNFEACFDRLRKTWLDSEIESGQLVYEYSICALDLEPLGEGDGEANIESEPALKTFREKAALEVDSLQALMERSQIIWLCLIALFTILGLNF